jgi:hypothetical protein
MSERKRHGAGCHCGAVRDDVEGDLTQVICLDLDALTIARIDGRSF